MRAVLKALVVTAALLSALGACGDDDDGSASTATTEASTTTSDETTTTSALDSTTTTAGEVELGDEPTFRDDGPSGSGCDPGGGEELPDGWWYGDLIVPPGVGLSFDLACYYTGPAAEAEAARRGDEVTNDYYVVNDNDLERMLTIAEGATAACVDEAAQMQLVDCTPPDVAGDWNVWVRVVDGEVDRMIEQYAP